MADFELTDFIVLVDGVPGESKRVTNGIEVFNFHWGVESDTSVAYGSGAGTGRSRWDHFSFTAHVDTAVSQLQLKCGTQAPIGKVTFQCLKGGGKPYVYMETVFTEVLLTQVSIDGNGSGLPLVHVTASYGKIESKYMPQSDKGNLTGNYPFAFDVKANAAG